MNVDVIIIGGGAAGLTAAAQLKQSNNRVLVIERGKRIYDRKHQNAFDIANGVGGAGLFSDGKISFYPSATKLWKLNKNELEKAYDFFLSFLAEFDVDIPKFEEKWKDEIILSKNEYQKRYDSILIDLPTRLNIIYKLCDIIHKENIMVNLDVCKISKSHNYYIITAKNSETGEELSFNTKAIIITAGKHSYSYLSKIFHNVISPSIFNKSEIGIRIECPAEDFDFYNDPQIDIKFIKGIGEKTEIRTFCCCRNGIVIESSSYDLISFNGSSHEKESDLCNIGITIRVNQEETSIFNREIQKIIIKKDIPHKTNIDDFMKGDSIFLSNLLDKEIRSFLLEYFPQMSKSQGYVYYPTYESIGKYPLLSEDLQLSNESIWFAGDATGLFRGLTPAFVSGHYTGQKVSLYLKSFENNIFDKLCIKKSKTNKYPVAFTAQSKLYFYCRDAVCEYVFNKGFIPINPFRIFGYFLDDRVNRNIVRNGNNEMISRSDELWVFGPISDGVLFEIARCKQLGIPIRFFNIATKACEIKEIDISELVFEPEVHAKKIKKDDLINFIYGNLAIKSEVQLNLFEQYEYD
ncbi:MAG: putative FAD-dependent dehydrogenase-like protein [Bacteroidetes bacterium]|nr:putative FAD-dependent dehydrogenase-like protein [Bacteroidota bacterium]